MGFLMSSKSIVLLLHDAVSSIAQLTKDKFGFKPVVVIILVSDFLFVSLVPFAHLFKAQLFHDIPFFF